ncbi:hypothetical protein [Pseudanabaena minima]|uniref:hypothetical protein n=1 Tax=Pseudanabaena minima TaxID=890415 RepID=UPI003DA9CD11
MDKQNFDNNRKKLTTIQKVDFEYFLKSKNDDEIAEIRGVDRSTVNKNITKIAATFGIKRDKLINDSGRDGIEKIVHRQKLLKLCLKHIPDEVTRPHIYEESGDSNPITDPAFMSKSNVNTDNRPQISINPQNIPASKSIPELTTLEFIGRKDDLTDLANLSRQAKIVLIKAEHGIGKTWLAKEFFSRHPDQYEVVQINFSLLLSEAAKAEEKLPIILKQLNQQTSGSFELNLDCLRARLLDRSQKTVAFLISNSST